MRRLLLLLWVVMWVPQHALPQVQGTRASSSAPPLAFIDTSVENASPVWYERDAEGIYHVHLLYDHERDAPNRAAGHIHFALVGTPGAEVTLEFRNLDNIWNGRPGSVAGELTTVAISDDGIAWRKVPTSTLPGNRIRLTATLRGPRLYVARLEPYRVSDLNRLLDAIRTAPQVHITPIGTTVDGQSLEIVRIGRDSAPHRVFVRARAHPWEAGSSWVVHGLIERLVRDDAATRALLDRYVVYILPMANKDGVARGRTRFNLLGKDLNRNWDAPANAELAPENAALERWLEAMIASNRTPHLAIELHNDGRGLLHISRPPVPQLDRYLGRMETLERVLRQYTWFTEGHTDGAFRNSGTLGDGWLERYGIDALVHELNANWIEGVGDYPSAAHWRTYGASLADVLAAYFDETRSGR
jgi:hypothetical protein